MERSSFFNSVNGDRKYKAEDFASYFGSFISNGVFPNPGTNLQVVSNDNMTVTLKPGKGWVNGYYYENTDDLILLIDAADGVLDRIDRVVLRLDYVNREIKTVVKKGTFASNPTAPTLQRDMDIYELGIADIKVNKGAISILQTDIIDTRLDLSLCGITNSLITVDVGIITEQFSNDFTEWFERIKGQLGEDPAGNLQNQIDILNQNKVSNVTFNEHKADNAKHLWQKIDEIVITQNTTQVDITIPQEYSKIMLILSMHSTVYDAAQQHLNLRFNDDTGNNYFTASNSAKNYIELSTAITNYFRNDIPRYTEVIITNDNNEKTGYYLSNGAGFANISSRGILWNSIDKINKISLFPSANAIASGGTIHILGVK